MENIYPAAMPSYMPLAIRSAITSDLMTPFLAPEPPTEIAPLFTKIYQHVKKGASATKDTTERKARLALLNEWVEHCKADMSSAYAEIRLLYTKETSPPPAPTDAHEDEPQPVEQTIPEAPEDEPVVPLAPPPRRAGPSPFELLLQQYDSELASPSASSAVRRGRRGPVLASEVPIYIADEEAPVEQESVAPENPALARLLAMADQLPALPQQAPAKRVSIFIRDTEEESSESDEGARNPPIKRSRNAPRHDDELDFNEALLARV